MARWTKTPSEVEHVAKIAEQLIDHLLEQGVVVLKDGSHVKGKLHPGLTQQDGRGSHSAALKIETTDGTLEFDYLDVENVIPTGILN